MPSPDPNTQLDFHVQCNRRSRSVAYKFLSRTVKALAFCLCCPILAVHMLYHASGPSFGKCGSARVQQDRPVSRQRDFENNPHRDFSSRSKQSMGKRRALTIPLHEEHVYARKTEDQVESLLFRLPFELRRKIYRAALGMTEGGDWSAGRTFHITSPISFPPVPAERLRVFSTSQSSITPPLDRTQPYDDSERSRAEQLARTALLKSVNRLATVSLMRSCRRVYSEMVELMYHPMNVFAFSDGASLVAFAKMVPRKRFEAFRSVVLCLPGKERGIEGRRAIFLRSLEEMQKRRVDSVYDENGGWVGAHTKL